MSWWNNTTKVYEASTSPSDMTDRYGGLFVDGNGEAQTTGDWNWDSDVTAVAGIQTKYWTGTTVVTEMSQGEKDAVDAAEAAALVTSNRATAAAAPDDTQDPIGWETRALIELLNKRDNYLVNRIAELQSALDNVKASSGPADNIRAAIPASWMATATRPRGDAIQDYKDDINAGGADS